MKILFTAGGSPGNEMSFLNLKSLHDFWFVDADIDRISEIIPKNKKIIAPLVNEQKYFKTIKDFCFEKKIDILVPGIDEELLEIYKNFTLDEKTILFLPSVNFIKNMLDKYLSMKILKGFGIPVPETLKLEDAQKFDFFPLILKPRWGRGSRGIQVIYQKKELELHMQLKELNKEQYICQAFEKGTEYTVQILNHKKQNKALIIPLKVLLKKGVTLSAEIDFDKEIIEVCNKLSIEFNETNVFNVQLIKSNIDDSIKIFEVNPRFSTTTCILSCMEIDPFNFENLNIDQSDIKIFQGLKLNRTLTNTVR